MNIREIAPRILLYNEGDYEACKEFYVKKLGLVMVYDVEGGYGSFAMKEGEPPCLAIFNANGMSAIKGYKKSPATTHSDFVTLLIGTDDFQRDYKTLKEAGVEFIGEPQFMEGWGGVTSVFFRDPVGTLLELTDGNT